MAVPSARRGAGRPKRRVLSRRLILETGLRLMDAHGVDRAGMRAIADELGVRPSSLYNHVAGTADLIAGVRELISDRIDTGVFAAAPWDAALEAWARSYRSAFAAHPPTIALLAVTPLAERSDTTRMYDAVVAGLVRAGWPPERVLTVIVALESFILGSALDYEAADDMFEPGPRADVPAFTAAYRARERALAASGTRPADAAFELGLRALVSGFRAEHAALTRG
ncbi:TetR/AcrR family transcriptional regulator C-terminal domain-containing protein [Leucobacter allii]|uniref:TetR/AcrR family transcriptional regulator C-terminal domain-containing protein n=1 Tax=Leucobacter allii TaxID=2932247 RepID=UPI001FD61E91|nr:TetR/AcrR family transcriptional regulator C-terminal domain-containing protein [Leucobacter allii]UOR01019.1 TetR/AcrR family transcriptional regulator C-terminal domain-containing protein [Leucobacter allii]